jgi:hypothetical protein
MPASPDPEVDLGEITGPPLFSAGCQSAPTARAAERQAPERGARSRPASDLARGLGAGYWEHLGLRQLPAPLRAD